jgi:uncharacterized membrane protein YjgN (DUF898 family)
MTASQADVRAEQVEFTGAGAEYFRIWIVNLALTLTTLGIYSAWAKVRRLQYFYRNTALAGSSFDYHGNPLAILKGRVIAVGLLLIYNIAGSFNIALGLAVLAVLLAMAPWLIQRSISFRLVNSSYRGLRFHFAGAMGGAYQAFLLWPALGYFTLGLLVPQAHREIKHYQHNNSRFGGSSFRFDASGGAFYGIYLKALGMFLLLAIGFGLLSGMLASLEAIVGGGIAGNKEKIIGLIVVGVLVFYVLVFLLVLPWFSARMQNLVWNHTALEQHSFKSDVRARDLFAIYFTNFIAIVLTLGLFKPFADVRLARYRLRHMTVLAHGALDEFLATQQQHLGAMGEETADLFDVDISF